MVTRVSVRGPADILALVPQMLPDEPRQSVVLIGKRGLLRDAVLRVDLPRDESSTTHKGFATSVVGMLCKVPDIERVIVAVYSDLSADERLPHEGFIDILLRRIHQSGIHIIDAVCQASNAWGSYLDDEHDRIRPLDELDAPAARFQALVPEPAEREPAITATAEEREAVRERIVEYRVLLDDLRAALDESAPADGEGDAEHTDVPDELEPMLDLPRFFEDALYWDEATLRKQAPLLTLILQGPPARDNAMLQWAFTLDLGYALEVFADRFHECGLAPDDELSQLVGDLMMGRGPRPDTARIDRALYILRTLVALTEEPQHPPLLCMLGWLNWALGRGSRCGEYVEQVVAIDRHYGMAEVLHTMASNGQLPEWVYQAPDA